MQRGFAPLIIIVVAFLIFAGIIYFTITLFQRYVSLHSTNTTTTQTNPITSTPQPNTSAGFADVSPLPSFTPNTSPIPKGYQRVTIQTIQEQKPVMLDQLLLKDNASVPQQLNSGNFLFYDQNQVVTYDPFQRKQKQIYVNNTTGLINYVKYDEQGYLYITKITQTTPATIWMDIISLNNNSTVKTINNVQPVIYGGLEHLLTFQDNDIIGTFGGDACSGSGKIFQVPADTKKAPAEILKTGGGCNPEPSYLGTNEQTSTLFFQTTSPTNDARNFINDKLVAFDLKTKQLSPIMDLKPITEQIQLIHFDPTTKVIYLIVGDEVWFYNPSDKTVQKKTILPNLTSLTPTNTAWQVAYNNKLYGVNLVTHEVVIADGETKKVSSLKLYASDRVTPAYIGIVNNLPLFAILESNP